MYVPLAPEILKVCGSRDIIFTALCRERIAASLRDVSLETLVSAVISLYEGTSICFTAEEYASAIKIPTIDNPNNLFNIVSNILFMT
jgi:hypothetical protein